MIGRFLKVLTSLVLAAAIAGCSLFAPKTQSVTINGEPSGCRVIVNGNVVTVPCAIQVKRNQNVQIHVSKKGYVPSMMSCGYSLNLFGMLDLIGTICWLVPVVGLLTPGAYSLDQENFFFSLTPDR